VQVSYFQQTFNNALDTFDPNRTAERAPIRITVDDSL
jgi:hypothetical protein